MISEETRKKLRESHLGQVAWNKGKKGVQVAWNKGLPMKILHPRAGFQKGNQLTYLRSKGTGKSWNAGKPIGGENVSYGAKHVFLYKNYGKPSICEECGKTELVGKKIHWANISGEYKRERTDWKRLCASCHIRFDMTDERREKLSKIHKKLIKKRLRNNKGQLI